MNFEDLVFGEVVVFSLFGKILSFEDSAPLRERIKEHLDAKMKNFVLDLAAVPWINSEGIGLLASTMATVAKAGGRVVLANINDKVERVLTITKCNKIIKHFNSREEALEFFSSEPGML